MELDLERFFCKPRNSIFRCFRQVIILGWFVAETKQMTLQHVSQHSNHELILHEFLHLFHCTAFVKDFTLVNLMGRVLYGAVLVEPFVH